MKTFGVVGWSRCGLLRWAASGLAPVSGGALMQLTFDSELLRTRGI